MSTTISATYRGYRKQALYILTRVLEDANPLHIYRPENHEDLALYDAGQQLLEVVQVKDYSSGLSLSDLKPHSTMGFFARMRDRMEQHPNCRTFLALFGPLGPELAAAIRGAEPARGAIVRKLRETESTVSTDEAHRLLNALDNHVIQLDEAALLARSHATLRDTMCAHSETAMELLLFWVYSASEHATPLSRQLLLAQIERIGRYVAALRDHSSEWMTTIIPISDDSLDEHRKQALREEYRNGAHATWEHILADADVARTERLSELHAQACRTQATIIRGASGQGKSSLGWRYVREYATEGLRFHVRFVQDRRHAASVAHALRTHAEHLQMRPLVYLDLAPSDSGWPELVRDLVANGFRVLIAAREEDLHRTSSALESLTVGEIRLESLSRTEARGIYSALADSLGTEHLLDFDDAWARFHSSGNEPLLEFTHLVTQGQTLSSKIGAQIARLQREARAESGRATSTALRILALCAVANAFDARVDFTKLCIAVNVEPLSRPTEPFEREYLLRTRREGATTTVGPLHPVRSQAIVEALLDDEREVFGELTLSLLPLVCEEDIGRFLLHTFSRRPWLASQIESALTSTGPLTWSAAASIARAMLWLGVSRYEERNRAPLSDAIREFGEGWYLVDDVMFGFEESRTSLISTLLKDRPPPVTRLAPKENIFQPIDRWLSLARAPDAAPQDGSSWRAAGDVAFWIGTRSLPGRLRTALETLLPARLASDCPLEDVAHFISGRATFFDADFDAWHRQELESLRTRVVEETQSLALDDDGITIKIYFPLFVADGARAWRTDGADFNEQATRRIQMLRMLFPGRQVYASDGVGSELLQLLDAPNDTTKRIPAKNLFDERVVWVNTTVSGLVNYRHQRPRGWPDYRKRVETVRDVALDFCEALLRFWERLLLESSPRATTLQTAPIEQLTAAADLHAPMLPTVAVDEWGFLSEQRADRAATDSDEVDEVRLSLARLQPWCKSLQGYASAIRTLASRVTSATVRHIAMKTGRKDLEFSDADAFVAMANARKVWETLAELHRHYEAVFPNFVNPELVRREMQAMRSLWFVALAFNEEPRRRRKNASTYLLAEFLERRARLLDNLRKEIASAHDSRLDVRVHSEATIEGSSCLVIEVDVDEPALVAGAFRETMLACWRATQLGTWGTNHWVPLVREWKELIVLVTTRGRLLRPTGTRLPLELLFLSADFEPNTAKLIPRPVASQDLDQLGVRIWDTPLIRAILAWSDAIAAAIMVASRTAVFVAFLEERPDSEQRTSTVERAVTRELRNLLNQVRVAEEELRTVLGPAREAPFASPDATRQLRTLVAAHTRDGASGLDEFPGYVDQFRAEPTALDALILATISEAIAQGAPC